MASCNRSRRTSAQAGACCKGVPCFGSWGFRLSIAAAMLLKPVLAQHSKGTFVFSCLCDVLRLGLTEPQLRVNNQLASLKVFADEPTTGIDAYVDGPCGPAALASEALPQAAPVGRGIGCRVQ